MPEPRPVALVGDLLATQAKAQGAAAILVDASVRDVEELAELGLPIWARWVRVGARQGRRRARSASPCASAARRSARATCSCSTPTASRSSRHERVDEVLEASRERAERERVKREKLAGGRAVLRPRRPARESRRHDDEPIHDLAHIAHAELLTPFPDESLRFFVELFGMQIEHREGQSVFLRGWGEYQPYGLKLTESELPGLGHTALRAWSPAALERRVAAIEATRVRHRLERRRPRARARLRVPRSRRPPVRALLRAGPLRAARAAAPAPEERAPAPRRPRARRSSGSITSTCWPPTSPPTGGSRPSSSATGPTSRSSTTTARSRAPG